MNRILLIEDDRDIVELVRYNLEADGFGVNSVSDGAKGMVSLRQGPPDLLFSTLRYPACPALRFAARFGRILPLTTSPF
jgi:DNA-binding response OmpR family regulator